MSESNNLPAVQQQSAALEHFTRVATHGLGINAGAVAIESERAIAEAQGQLTLAKRFPRSVTAATTEFLDACKNAEFAKKMFYSVPNRGSGLSIRAAEEAARCYGNFVYGHRELSRSEGKSEIEVYAWDMEKNNRSSRQITVMHVTDTKNGPKKLTDQTDIDNKIANVASKQMRGRILALMPKSMMAAGEAQAKITLAGGSDKPISERLIAMAAAFNKFGVNNEMLVAHLGHPVDNTTIDELADLMGIFNAIKDGAKASDYFGQAAAEKQTDATAEAIKAQAKQGTNQAATASKEAAATPAASPAPAATRQRSKPAQADSNAVKESAPESGHKVATDAATKPDPEPTSTTEAASQTTATGGEPDDVF